ncbi:MAG: CarD family transcriptional regulator [Armatimonadota bacterium]
MSKSNGKLNKGTRVVHHMYGVGRVEKVETKNILGRNQRFSEVSFQEGKLKLMVNLDQRHSLIRSLIGVNEVPKVLKFIEKYKPDKIIKSAERYVENMKKIKTADVYKFAEVIKDLSDLSKVKKLTPKEQDMLDQSKKILTDEFCTVKSMTKEKAEVMLNKYCRN